MAFSREEWEVVKAFYERGLSLAEITSRREVKITDRSTISKMAKKEGWFKGEKSIIVEKEINAKILLNEARIEKSTYNKTETKIHDVIVDERVRDLLWFKNAGMELAMKAVKAVTNESTPKEIKEASEALAVNMKVAQVVPYYPNSATQVVNNLNAQQSTEKRTLAHFYGKE